MRSLLSAEWLKLRTTRLLYGTIPAAIGISIAAVAGTILSGHAAELGSPDGVRRVFSVTGAGAIVVLVVGILIATGEFRHGTAVDTFLTTPRRRDVITAKLLTGAGLGLAVGVVTALAAIGTASLLYPQLGASFELLSREVWLSASGTLVYTTLFAVVGVSVGALLRNQVFAITGALAWIAIVEHTLVNLAPAIGRWLPAGAGQAIVRTPIDGLLSPLAGTAILAGYCAVIAVAGVRIETARDT
jgi:ABC-2 type transport system permease protein